jgi:hypothetical protein
MSFTKSVRYGVADGKLVHQLQKAYLQDSIVEKASAEVAINVTIPAAQLRQ